MMPPGIPWLTEKQLDIVWKLTCWLWIALIMLLELADLIGHVFSKISPPDNLLWFVFDHWLVLWSASFLSAIFFGVVTVGLALVMAISRKLPVRTEVTIRKKLTIRRK